MQAVNYKSFHKDKGDALCFTATATYPCRATSNLSEVYCCDEPVCPSDTTFATDTLIAGEPFIDGVVYSVGRHDSIFETITLPNGCDSVVIHTLVVKPNPTDVELVDSEKSILFPNPAQTYIAVQISGCMHYEIYSMDGALMDVGATGDGIIPIVHLPNGLYLLRLLSEERVFYAKFKKED